MTSVQVGDACEGRVQSVADFGAFVELYKDGAASGVEGLVHLSEMSWDRVANPREAVKVGQVVMVKVISVDVKTQRIGLSMRQLMVCASSTILEGVYCRTHDYCRKHDGHPSRLCLPHSDGTRALPLGGGGTGGPSATNARHTHAGGEPRRWPAGGVP